MEIKLPTADKLIEAILASHKWETIFGRPEDFEDNYKAALALIHPDKCALPKSLDATVKLNEWRDRHVKGIPVKDDIGIYRTNNRWVHFERVGSQAISWSRENLAQFWNYNDKAANNFNKYMPKEAVIGADGTLTLTLAERAVPISGLKLPQEHVNWILNRLFEYCAYLQQIGMVHCGLIPESVFIRPEDHGIQVISFYHLSRAGKKVGTISAKYSSWYPASLFTTKIASAQIDLEMAKKIAVYLLGEQSGNAIKLRKTHNEEFISFLLTVHTDAYKCMDEYKALLAKLWPKEFHVLNL